MKNNRGIFFLAFLSLTLLSFSACSGKSKDRSMESVFPKESALVMEVDFASDGQAANFNKLINAFPTTGLAALFRSGFDEKASEADVSWSGDIAPIFKGKWKVGIGITGSFVGKDSDDLEVYIAAELSESKALRAFINKMIEKGVGSWKNVEYEKDGGVEYWTKDFGDMYLALDGDVFFLTSSNVARKAAIKRLSQGGGPAWPAGRFDKDVMTQEGFFKYYFSNDFIGDSKEVWGEIFEERYVKAVEAFKDGYVLVSALEDGFMLVEDVNYDLAKDDLKALYVNPDYKLSLINKVNSKGLFYYSENSSLKSGMLGFLFYGEDEVIEEESVESDDVGLDNDLGYLKTNVFGALGSSARRSRNSLSEFKAEIKPFVQKFDVLLRSPYAIAVSDRESFLPAIAVYFQLGEGDEEEAKALLNDFDGYVDQLLKEINNFMGTTDEIKYLKKDVVVVNGAALHKFYVDWGGVPQEEVTRWSDELGIDVTTLKNELYYGLMDDNVFVLAWYPDFTTEYGKNPLAQNEDYLEAVKKLGDVYGSSVTYVNTAPFLKFTDRFVQVWKASLSESEGAEMESMYKLYFRKLVGTVRYFIGSGLYTEGKILGRAFVRIEKVEE